MQPTNTAPRPRIRRMAPFEEWPPGDMPRMRPQWIKTGCWSLLVGAVMVAASLHPAAQNAGGGAPEETAADPDGPTDAGTAGRGHYSIVKGAAGYAQIVGVFGALAVPAIVFLFTSLSSVTPPGFVVDRGRVALAAGLLVVAMIGSLAGAIGLASVGGEEAETPNLPAAIMFVGVSAVVSLVTMLGAFEVMASVYLAEQKKLFQVIVWIGGLVGVFFVSCAVGDSWIDGPAASGSWVAGQKAAYRKSLWLAVTALGVVVAGILIRYIGKVTIPTSANWPVWVGLGVAVLALGWGVGRSQHSRSPKALRWWEAYGTVVFACAYVVVLAMSLP
ncbi:hypothetical protein GCM10018790_61770 [Kitasatospora xanthocidica]|uniref:hypothetical protein n=1 Tax=Kitasatospora xanthocidica TaxID=83382 RepID=UPI001673931E|nr:hypothetical protein [Kitasatospora xanthocidica]GHF75533.1 hypothetical protein GCM10018790_61770 [Kitasatospora xanthocidica]